MCAQFTSELHVEDKFGQDSATFVSGEPIWFKMRITNNSNSPAKLGYDGCPSIRFVITDSADREVFDSLPEGTACTMLLRHVEYGAYETKEFDLEWSQTHGDDDSQVPSGQYTASARDRSVECAGELRATRSFMIQ